MAGDIKIEVEGLRELERALLALGDEAKMVGSLSVATAARELQQQLRSAAPRGIDAIPTTHRADRRKRALYGRLSTGISVAVMASAVPTG